MKYRHPLFVSGFPYALFLIAYSVILKVGETMTVDQPVPADALFPLYGAFLIALIGSVYYLSWLATTGRVLRQEADKSLPTAWLLLIPFANYYWIWRYSAAAEKYLPGKRQGVTIFLMLFLFGPIGAGILQDYYNKMPANNQQTT